jgi:hypothetical protein
MSSYLATIPEEESGSPGLQILSQYISPTMQEDLDNLTSNLLNAKRNLQHEKVKLVSTGSNSILEYNKQINDLNSKLSMLTHNIVQENNIFSIKRNMIYYLSIIASMGFLVYIIITILMKYSHRNKISNISTKLNKYKI